MADINDYLRVKIQDHVLRGTAYSAPATVYVALCTTTPIHSDTGTQIQSGSGGTGVEVTGGNYARVAVTANTSNFGDSVGVITNTNAITWSAVTWSGTVTGVAILDAATNGNCLWAGNLTANKTVSSGDTFSFAASALTLTLS